MFSPDQGDSSRDSNGATSPRATSPQATSPQATYPPEDDFHLRLYRAFHAQCSFLRAGHRQTGLGSGQPKLLDYISRHEACTQRDLARYFDLDAAGVCRMLDALERNGFITSAPDPADRRAKHLRITERGRSSLKVWLGHCQELEEALLAGFSDDERARFANYLERAYLNLRGKSPHVLTPVKTEMVPHATTPLETAPTEAPPRMEASPHAMTAPVPPQPSPNPDQMGDTHE